MKLTKNIFALLVLLFALPLSGMSCVVDVTVAEGATIEMCADAPLSISGSNGFVSYAWTGPETLAGQTITPQFSGLYTVAATDGVGCISTASIQVTINASPTPTIISSEGNPICASGGSTLSLSNPYVSYDWGGGNTGATFFASGAGSYSVTVVDGNGCAGQDNIALTEHNFTLTSASVSGCTGSTAVLTASGGTSYAWSTSETGSSIVVTPQVATNYSVTVTNGSCSEILTISVDPVTVLDFDLVDTLYMGVGETETLTGPTDGFVSYNWYPTDQIDNPLGPTVTVTANSSHILNMDATHNSGCVLSESVVIIVVDLTIPNGFSPNDDGLNDLYVIPQLNQLDGSVKVWNRWGDLVLEEDHYENDWNGSCQTALCAGNGSLPEGTYFYHITVDEITFKGYLTLKR